MIIMGIDPGTAITGYAILHQEKSALESLKFGCIYTEKNQNTPARLEKIYNGLREIVVQYKPEVIALEKIFFNVNIKTALSVGEARGVVFLLAAHFHIAVKEYTPLEVKSAIVGYGRAVKKQVQKMVAEILNLKEMPKPDDAADALALAICYAHSRKLIKAIEVAK